MPNIRINQQCCFFCKKKQDCKGPCNHYVQGKICSGEDCLSDCHEFVSDQETNNQANSFQAKRRFRIDRHRYLAEKNRELSEKTFDKARSMADIIPLGQPILIGHHSEKRDRNYRDRISKTYEKAGDFAEKADYHLRQVQRAENGSAAISSDDPDAIKLLKEKLENRKAAQSIMKAANKIIRSKRMTSDQKKDELLKIGATEEQARILLDPGPHQKIMLFGESEFIDTDGFPQFALTNNNANIKRIQDRITVLERSQKEISTEIHIGDISIIDSVEEHRILIVFPGIPAEYIRQSLKHSGFKWSPSSDAWKAYRSAKWRIPGIIALLTAMPAYVNPTMIPSGSDTS